MGKIGKGILILCIIGIIVYFQVQIFYVRELVAKNQQVLTESVETIGTIVDYLKGF